MNGLKKICALGAAVAVMSFAGGCAAESQPPAPKLAADGGCAVIYKDTRYACTIRFPGKDIETLTMAAPGNVEGLTFRRSSEGIGMSYSSLICRSQKQLLPENSFPRAAADAVHDLRKNASSLKAAADDDGKGYVFTGSDYVVKTDERGIIDEIIL